MFPACLGQSESTSEGEMCALFLSRATKLYTSRSTEIPMCAHIRSYLVFKFLDFHTPASWEATINLQTNTENTIYLKGLLLPPPHHLPGRQQRVPSPTRNCTIASHNRKRIWLIRVKFLTLDMMAANCCKTRLNRSDKQVPIWLCQW